MTVQELVDFISKYDANTQVTMTYNTVDNPLKEDYPIEDVVAIERANGALSIVIIPE